MNMLYECYELYIRYSYLYCFIVYKIKYQFIIIVDNRNCLFCFVAHALFDTKKKHRDIGKIVFYLVISDLGMYNEFFIGGFACRLLIHNIIVMITSIEN